MRPTRNRLESLKLQANYIRSMKSCQSGSSFLQLVLHRKPCDGRTAWAGGPKICSARFPLLDAEIATSGFRDTAWSTRSLRKIKLRHNKSLTLASEALDLADS